MSGIGLVQRSFYGGVMILVILTIRMVLIGRLPKRTFPILWGAALVRLLVPISLSSVFSVYSFWRIGEKVQKLGNCFHEIAEGDLFSGLPSAQTATWHMSAGQGVLGLGDGTEGSLLLIIWGIGVFFCAVFFGTAYIRCIWRFRASAAVESAYVRQWLRGHKRGQFISVRQSGIISAPLTYGFLRPVILLPEGIEWNDHNELEYVLQHEYVHICHYDGVLKLVMTVVLCIHWFNPLVWAMAGMLNRDIELACDEGVLHQFGEQSRAGYAMALIGMEEKKRRLMPFYNGFSKNAIEERIGSIMKYRKKTYLAGIMAGMLVLTIVLLFATSAQTVEATGEPGSVPENEADMRGENIPTDPPSDMSFAASPDRLEQGIPADMTEINVVTNGGTIPVQASDKSNMAEPAQPSINELSEDEKQLEQLALAFWEAYLSGDTETLMLYLAEDYSWDLDVFPDGRDGHVAKEAALIAVKGQNVENMEIGEACEIWVEFRPAAAADYLEYLTLEVIKEQDGWKVSSYGLEM